jgi:membrane-bound serine protease (ClpP class)
LLLLAVALFILEATVTSYGILGIGGAIAMVLGAVLLIEGPPELQISWAVAIAVTLPFALITIFLLSLVIRSYRNKVVTGDTGMVNEEGTAYTALEPKGKVFVHGEFWDAVSTIPVAEGARVRVVAVEGLTVKVEPIS